MVNCIYQHKEVPSSCELGSSELWKYKQQLSKKQLEAISKMDENSHRGLLRIIQALLPADSNGVLSPSTLYCALLGLASVCAGTSQQEILDAVFCEKDQMQIMNAAVREGVTGDSGASYCSMGSSLWLNNKINIKEEQLLELCKAFDADAFIGEMGTAEMDAAIQQWTNASTGNMLKGHIKAIKTEPNTAMEMLTTSYFKAMWFSKFWDRDTTRGDFYINEDTAVRCSYMKDTEDTKCYVGKKFTAVCKVMEFGHAMWFVLPEQGVTIAELVNDTAAMEFAVNPSVFTQEKCRVTMRIPRFEISSKMDIRTAMRAMGIHSVFDPEAANLSEITDEPQIYLSKADHATRVKITEEGVEAAALVEMGWACAGIPPELRKLDFTLDRPFLFAISKNNKVPMYVGTIMDPTKRS